MKIERSSFKGVPCLSALGKFCLYLLRLCISNMNSYQNKYQLNSSQPMFGVVDDDMTQDFLKSSSASYLAADRLQPSSAERAVIEAEQRRQDLLQQMKKVEANTLESSKRSLVALAESEKVGVETAKDLIHQREQLQNTEKNLDVINSDLKSSQKSINGIKSVFSSLRQWWGAPKKPADGPKTESSDSLSAGSPTSVNDCSTLGIAVENCQAHVSTNETHPALKLRGFDEDEEAEEEDKFGDDFRARTQFVNKKLESDLDNMSLGLARLKGLAQGLGTEIEDQNKMLTRIQNKADQADLTIHSQNTQMNKILKR